MPYPVEAGQRVSLLECPVQAGPVTATGTSIEMTTQGRGAAGASPGGRQRGETFRNKMFGSPSATLQEIEILPVRPGSRGPRRRHQLLVPREHGRPRRIQALLLERCLSDELPHGSGWHTMAVDNGMGTMNGVFRKGEHTHDSRVSHIRLHRDTRVSGRGTEPAPTIQE